MRCERHSELYRRAAIRRGLPYCKVNQACQPSRERILLPLATNRREDLAMRVLYAERGRDKGEQESERDIIWVYVCLCKRLAVRQGKKLRLPWEVSPVPHVLLRLHGLQVSRSLAMSGASSPHVVLKSCRLHISALPLGPQICHFPLVPTHHFVCCPFVGDEKPRSSHGKYAHAWSITIAMETDAKLIRKAITSEMKSVCSKKVIWKTHFLPRTFSVSRTQPGQTRAWVLRELFSLKCTYFLLCAAMWSQK